MQSGVSVTERAFEMARSGSVSTIVDIKRALHREGYDANAGAVPRPWLERRWTRWSREKCSALKLPSASAKGLNPNQVPAAARPPHRLARCAISIP
jgi:hypothetical protein